jgi:hypothetical protein
LKQKKISQACESFEKAIALDPRFAIDWAQKALETQDK